MELDYLTPQYVQHLHDEVLLHTMMEYRHAASLLEGHPAPASQQLRTRMLEAVELLEQEFERRQPPSPPSG